MAKRDIDILGLGELPLIVELYNQVYQPAHDIEFFRRRFLGRYNPLMVVANMDERPVGFSLGFELKPTIFFEWLYGVLPDYRRTGIASQLMDGVHAWSREHGYEQTRLECHNRHRPMLHLCIAKQYDVVGIRWDSDRHDNLVIFEKDLSEV